MTKKKVELKPLSKAKLKAYKDKALTKTQKKDEIKVNELIKTVYKRNKKAQAWKKKFGVDEDAEKRYNNNLRAMYSAKWVIDEIFIRNKS